MKKILIISIFFLNVSLFSQNKKETNLGSILGKVIDSKTKQALPYVNIVCKSKKSNTVFGGISDAKGLFFVNNVPLDSISVSIQFIGYETIVKNIVVTNKHKKINLGTLLLVENTTNLDEIIVQAETSIITQKIDRKVINVGRDLALVGTNSLQMLENIPLVNVDYLLGTVSLRGNNNVRILIDGKPSNLSTSQLLKQIPSSSVKTVELITNPSAKYNPEGMSGIINIILKKNTAIGFNGSLSAGAEHSKNTRPRTSLDMNYGIGKVNFYGNYSRDSGIFETNGFFDRADKDLTQKIIFLDNTTSNYLKAGMDFYIDNSNTFSFYTTQSFADTYFNVNTKTTENSNLIFDAENLSVFDTKEQSYNADYKLDLDDKGQNIELEINYSKSTNPQNDFNKELINPLSNVYNYSNTIVNDNSILLFNVDYTKPIKDGTLEVGVESRVEKTFNSIITNQEVETGGNPATTPKGNTSFNYDREIYSAYINYTKEFEAVALQTGVRFEDFSVEGLFSNTQQTNTESYFDNIISVYPSAFLTYNLSGDHQFQIGYSKRVDRPGVYQVTPIQDWTTPLTISVGNRTLRPQFTNSIEVNYSKNLKKGNITLGAFYRKTSDKIGRIINRDILNPDRQLLTYENYDTAKSYGVEFSSSYKLNSWWTVRPSSSLYVQDSEGLINNTREIVKNTLFRARVSNSFKASKELRFHVSSSYRGRSEGVQFKVKPYFLVNASASLSVLDGNGSLSLRAADIFNRNRRDFDTTNPFPQTGAYTFEYNTIYLGFSYRFRSGENRERDRKYRETNEVQGNDDGVL